MVIFKRHIFFSLHIEGHFHKSTSICDAAVESKGEEKKEIDDDRDLEIIKVGTKLTGILRKLVFSNLEKATGAHMDKVF